MLSVEIFIFIGQNVSPKPVKNNEKGKSLKYCLFGLLPLLFKNDLRI